MKKQHDEDEEQMIPSLPQDIYFETYKPVNRWKLYSYQFEAIKTAR